MSLRGFLVTHRGRRLRFPAGIAVVLAAGVGYALGGSKPSTTDLQTGPIVVDARIIPGFDRLKRDATRFGKLTWRGGFVLASPAKHFGGWSGLAIDADGKGFFAVSDAGTWMSGAISYDDKGFPQGLASVRLGAIQSKDGDPLSRSRDRDAEGLALLSGTSQKGTVLIAFERKHRIVRFDIDANGLSPAKGKVSLPAAAKEMSSNGGLEGIAVLRGGPNKGALVAFSERLRDDDDNHIGWIWESEDRPRQFKLTNDGDFDVTDTAPLPDGGLLVLERRFRVSEGVRMRLRLIKQQQLRAGETIDAETLVAADGSREIDNMEGLATHMGADGEIIVTMISDDNFNHGLQRTILLQFALSAGDIAASERGSEAAQP
ncbi:MAG TPA: esterase-like activity of phytase family protein [Hyphomicrobium sp.]